MVRNLRGTVCHGLITHDHMVVFSCAEEPRPSNWTSTLIYWISFMDEKWNKICLNFGQTLFCILENYDGGKNICTIQYEQCMKNRFIFQAKYALLFYASMSVSTWYSELSFYLLFMHGYRSLFNCAVIMFAEMSALKDIHRATFLCVQLLSKYPVQLKSAIAQKSAMQFSRGRMFRFWSKRNMRQPCFTHTHTQHATPGKLHGGFLCYGGFKLFTGYILAHAFAHTAPMRPVRAFTRMGPWARVSETDRSQLRSVVAEDKTTRWRVCSKCACASVGSVHQYVFWQ